MVYTSIAGTVRPVHTGNAVAGLMESEFLVDPKAQNDPLFVDSQNDDVISVGVFRKLVPRVSALFQNEYGIKKGDVVGLFGVNHIFTPVMHFSTIALGAISSPANIMYSSEELAHQSKMVKPPLSIVFDPAYPVAAKAAELANVKPKIVKFSEMFAKFKVLAQAGIAPEIEPVDVDGKTTPAYYCFSSGTSGSPKGVVTTHYNILANILQLHSSDTPFKGPTYSQSVVSPMSHIYASNVGVWNGAYEARKNLIFPKFDLEDFVKKSTKHKIKVMALVPPIILSLGKTDIIDRYPEFCDCVKNINSGAAPISKDVIALVNSKAPKVKITQGYGLTETSPITHSGARDLDNYDPSSIGWLIPGTEAILVDPETGKVVEGKGARGESWVRGPQVMAGYLDNPEATKDTITPEGWLKTGDVALVGEGEQFYIVDRIKESIKSNGHQVAPAELEAILLTNPKVLDAAVIGVYNANKTSEMPRAYTVLQKGTDPKEIVRWFNKQVAKHKRLWGGMVVLDAVPKSASGKILRKDLRNNAEKDKVIFGQELASL